MCGVKLCHTHAHDLRHGARTQLMTKSSHQTTPWSELKMWTIRASCAPETNPTFEATSAPSSRRSAVRKTQSSATCAGRRVLGPVLGFWDRCWGVLGLVLGCTGAGAGAGAGVFWGAGVLGPVLGCAGVLGCWGVLGPVLVCAGMLGCAGELVCWGRCRVRVATRVGEAVLWLTLCC